MNECWEGYISRDSLAVWLSWGGAQRYTVSAATSIAIGHIRSGRSCGCVCLQGVYMSGVCVSRVCVSISVSVFWG